MMRTTLAIDDDVLAHAKALADRDDTSVGKALSHLARLGIQKRSGASKAVSRLGFPILPKRGQVITLEVVNALRDEEE